MICRRILILHDQLLLRYLNNFIEAQVEFHEDSSKILKRVLEDSEKTQRAISMRAQSIRNLFDFEDKKLYSADSLRSIARNMGVDLDERFLASDWRTQLRSNQAELRAKKKDPKKKNQKPNLKVTSIDTIETQPSKNLTLDEPRSEEM